MALAEVGADDDEEVIGGPERGFSPSQPDPELPPLRLRGGVAARIVALVMLVVLGTGAAALVIGTPKRTRRRQLNLFADCSGVFLSPELAMVPPVSVPGQVSLAKIVGWLQYLYCF